MFLKNKINLNNDDHKKNNKMYNYYINIYSQYSMMTYL